MKDTELEIERMAYFAAADAALEKLKARYGEGPEGLQRFLTRKQTGPEQDPAEPA